VVSPGRTQSYSFLPLPTRLQALASLPAQIRLRPSALLPGVVAPEALASLYARRQLPGLVPLFHHPVGLRVPLRRAARVTDVRSTPGNTVLRLENLWAEVLKLPPQTLPPLSDLAMSTSVGESTPSTSVETPIQRLLHSHSKRHYRRLSRGTSGEIAINVHGVDGGVGGHGWWSVHSSRRLAQFYSRSQNIPILLLRTSAYHHAKKCACHSPRS